MSNYRRSKVAGGTYFFTVNLLERKKALLVDHIDELRDVIRSVQKSKPFHIDAWVVLPDNMHCIWTLPQDDSDYSGRWREIKKKFTKSLPNNEYRSKSRVKHCLVNTVHQWQYSTFHRLVQEGVYTLDWGNDVELSVGERGE